MIQKYDISMDDDTNRLSIKEPEKQEEQRDGQNDFQRFFAEQLLRPAAQHTAGKSADDNGDHQPHVRKVTGHQIPDKGADTGKAGADERNRNRDVHGKRPQRRHGWHQQKSTADAKTP